MRRLGTVGTGLAVAGVMLLVTASPALAGNQSPQCDFFETGWTRWKETGGYSSITPFWGWWRNRSGGLVRSETQYVGVYDYESFRIYGEGTKDWALHSVYVDTGSSIVPKGAWCDGPDLAFLNSAVGDDSSTTTLNLAPPPAAGFLPESVDPAPIHVRISRT